MRYFRHDAAVVLVVILQGHCRRRYIPFQPSDTGMAVLLGIHVADLRAIRREPRAVDPSIAKRIEEHLQATDRLIDALESQLLSDE